MSPQRKFYLSEKISQADKIVTIKGVDASHRLEKDMAAELRTLYSATAASYVYDLLRDVVAGAGISARREALPKAVTKTGTRSLLYLEKQPRRDVVPFLMNLLRGSASTNLGKSAARISGRIHRRRYPGGPLEAARSQVGDQGSGMRVGCGRIRPGGEQTDHHGAQYLH